MLAWWPNGQLQVIFLKNLMINNEGLQNLNNIPYSKFDKFMEIFFAEKGEQ